MFIYEKTMPNQAVCNWHRVDQLQIVENGFHAVVSSFALEEMQIVSWQDIYVIPPEFNLRSLSDVELALALPGAPFDGATVLDPADSDLNLAKARAWANIKIERDRAINAGVLVEGIGTFDSDDISQGRINASVTGAMLAQGAGVPFSVDWTLADNSVVTLDGPAMMQVGQAVLTYVAAQFAKAQAYRAQIEAATTVTEAKLVLWDIPSAVPPPLEEPVE